MSEPQDSKSNICIKPVPVSAFTRRDLPLSASARRQISEEGCFDTEQVVWMLERQVTVLKNILNLTSH